MRMASLSFKTDSSSDWGAINDKKDCSVPAMVDNIGEFSQSSVSVVRVVMPMSEVSV